MGAILLLIISFGGLILIFIGIFRGIVSSKYDSYKEVERERAYKANKEKYDERSNDFETKVIQLEKEYKTLSAELSKNWKDLKPNFLIDKVDGYNVYIARNKINDTLVIFKVKYTEKYKADKNWEDGHYVKVGKVLSGNKQGDFGIDTVIPVNKIIFFAKEGDVSYTTHTTGGGTNYGGALVGGLLGGEAGAIIASRQKVTTYTREHDNRVCILKLETGEETLPFKMYEFLNRLIPEKEYRYIIASSNQKSIDNILMKPVQKVNELKENSKAAELREFKNLLDEGIISKEEFEAQKNKLLQ